MRKRARRSGIYLAGATLCLVGGFFLSLIQTQYQYVISVTSLVLGLFLWSRNQTYLHRWGARTRQDEPLRHALRTLDDRYHLLICPAEKLPDYLLVGAMGVLVIEPSPVKGTVECVNNRWHHSDQRSLPLRWLLWFAPNPPLGNPAAEIERGVAATASYLRERLDDQPKVEGVVVFTDPKLTLHPEGCQTVALNLRSLRGHLRRGQRELSPGDITKVVDALTAAM
jgi:hypothetical protein